ncbi:histidine kinase [Streptomyces sp. NBC_01498]|uniref:sensor histidine kinase n=1 Tax=Streptomyces sp. NBC_01498 TaxID=2975870 RepID=UPI003FCD5199
MGTQWYARGGAARTVRAAARALGSDLWRTAAVPPSREGRPRWLEWRPALVSPLVVLAPLLFVINTNQYAFDYRIGVPIGVLLAVLQSASLVTAPFLPVLAWWASTIALVVVTSLAHPVLGSSMSWTDNGFAVQVLAVFMVALRARLRIAAKVLAFSVLAVVLCGALAPRLQDTGSVIAILVIAVVVGAALRGRQVARTELVVQEEITAEERARRTLLEERNRIARELHDVVAHHMSVISIQAQAAPHLAENPSEELRENLAGIRENAVEALTELRRVLGVLRSEDALADGARHAPQPSLERLDELIGNVRAAGVGITTRTVGKARPLPPGVGLSAFRIVQEALSNVMRHAPGAEVRVETGYHPTGVTVRVTNSAPDRTALPALSASSSSVPSTSASSSPATASPSPETGHGLLGMRERTAMLGGELATGATPDGGWEVTAILPTRLPAGSVGPAGSVSSAGPAGNAGRATSAEPVEDEDGDDSDNIEDTV